MVSKKEEIIELIAENLRDFSNIKPASHREVLYAVLDYLFENKGDKELLFQADFISAQELFSIELEPGLISVPTAFYEYVEEGVKHIGDLNSRVVYTRWTVTDLYTLLEFTYSSYDLENFRLYR